MVPRRHRSRKPRPFRALPETPNPPQGRVRKTPSIRWNHSHSIINKSSNLLKVKISQKIDLGVYRRFYRQNHGLFVSAGDAATFPAAAFSTPSSTKRHITRVGNVGATP